jgi:hypothetical protein
MKALEFAQTAIGVAALLAGGALAADPATVDWKGVPAKTLTLFYPAQSTYQWLRSAEHPGAQVVNTTGACITCHTDQEGKLGEKLVKANKLEPTPIDGKNGVVKLDVQVAYDSENAYFRFQWKTNDGGVPGFAAQGCWLTCHDGERDSRKQPSADEVTATAFFQAIKKNDVRKYLPSTRTDANASWQAGKSIDEIAKLKASGAFLDLIQWRGHRTNPVGMADDGYVLEYRNFDAGANPFASNMDAKTKQPRYMYDERKFGKKALTERDINKTGTVLLREENAVAFDSNAGWKAGDVLPQYYVSRGIASGSAADNKQAQGTWKDGMWTVVWARSLNLANPDDKALKEGKAYNFAFAVHDDNVTSRGHQISFPVTVGFGAKAVIEATKLK